MTQIPRPPCLLAACPATFWSHVAHASCAVAPSTMCIAAHLHAGRGILTSSERLRRDGAIDRLPEETLCASLFSSRVRRCRRTPAPRSVLIPRLHRACEAWNKDPVLTDKLVESGWMKNDAGRGFKVMHIYRSDCGDSAAAELRVALKTAGDARLRRRAADGEARFRRGLRVKAEPRVGSRWARRIRPDEGDDAGPPWLRRADDGRDGLHGPVRELPAARRQGPGDTGSCPK